MKNVLLIIAIAFTGFSDASVSNDKYLQDNENYQMIRLSVFNPEGVYGGLNINVLCINNYVFIEGLRSIGSETTSPVQFFKTKDDGTGSQPMKCDELKRNKPHDRKGNRID